MYILEMNWSRRRLNKNNIPVEWHLYQRQLSAIQAHFYAMNEIHVQVMQDTRNLLPHKNVHHGYQNLWNEIQK